MSCGIVHMKLHLLMSCKPGQKTNIVEQAIYKTAKCFARKRESNKDHHVCSAVFEVVNI